MNAQEYKAPESVSRVQSAGWFVGGVALIAAIFGAVTSPDKFYQSYLMAYLLVLGHHLSPQYWWATVEQLARVHSRDV